MKATKWISKKNLFILTMFILLLPICYTTFVLNRTAPTETRHIWINKWLEREAGIPPCWEGICPDKTTRQEVESILSLLPEVTSFHRTEELSENKAANIRWNFENSNDGGEVTFAANDGKVSTIALYINPRQHLSLKEVIDTYGDPTKILVYYCRETRCLVELLFLDQGFLVETISDVNQKEALITKELIVSSIWFYPNNENGYRSSVGVGKLATGIIHTWNGFGNYSSTR